MLGQGVSFVLTLAVTLIGLTAVTFVISRLTNIDPVLALDRRPAPARRHTMPPTGRWASTSR